MGAGAQCILAFYSSYDENQILLRKYRDSTVLLQLCADEPKAEVLQVGANDGAAPSSAVTAI